MTDAFAQTREQPGPMDGLNIPKGPPVFQARPQERQMAEAVSGQDGMPPQDVLDAAMILSQSCGEWKQPVPDKDAPPIQYSSTIAHHMKLCSVSNDHGGLSMGTEFYVALALVAVCVVSLITNALMAVAWVKKKMSVSKKLPSPLVVDPAS